MCKSAAVLAAASVVAATDLARTHHLMPDERCMDSLPGETTSADYAHDRMGAAVLNADPKAAKLEVRADDLRALLAGYAQLRVELAIKDVFTFEGGDERRAYGLDDLLPDFDEPPRRYGFQGLHD